MKNLLFICLILLTMSACSAHQDSGYYDRANKASQSAHNKLDHE